MGILDKLFGKKEFVEDPEEKSNNQNNLRRIEKLIQDLRDGRLFFGREEEALEEIGEPAVEPLIQALKDEDDFIRNESAMILGKIGDKRAVEPLIQALKDESRRVRNESAEALGRIGDKRAVEPLIQALNEDSDVRDKSAEALGKMGWQPKDDIEKAYYFIEKREWNKLVEMGTPAVEPLIQALNDEDSDVRDKSAEVLGKIKDERAVEPLIQALKDTESSVRNSAANALEKMEWQPKDDIEKGYYFIGKREWNKLVEMGTPAVEPLIRYLDNSDNQSSAAEALGKIGDARAVEPLIQSFRYTEWDSMYNMYVRDALVDIGEPAVEPLIYALKDENTYVREGAADALGEIGEPAAGLFIRALEEVLEEDKKDKTNKFKVHCPFCDTEFGIIEVPKGVGMWGKRFECKGCELSLHAMYTGGIDLLEVSAEALPVGEINKRCYGEPVPMQITKWEAIIALRGMGEQAVKPLIQFLKDEDVRGDAVRALGWIGDKRAVEPLIHTLKDDDDSVRSTAAEALGKIGDERAVEPLIQALKDENNVQTDAFVHKNVAGALGEIGDTRAVEHLIQVLKDEEKFLRYTAAEALGEIGDERVVEPLIQALKDNDKSVRYRAVEALGKIGDERAVEPLIQALNNDESVRYKAAEALGKIGDERAVEPLIQALKDEDYDVREEAAGALGEIGDNRAIEPLSQALKDNFGDVRKKVSEALEKIG